MATSNGSGEKQKIGIMGGTFDPIHNGHIQVALEAQKQLVLQRVLFVPAGQPWMKSNQCITPTKHRIEMVRLAIGQYPGFDVSAIETERRGPTYTIDTLRQSTLEYAGRAELFLILSWNTLAELPAWKNPGEIVLLATIVAVPRPGYMKPVLESLETKIPGITLKIIWLESPIINISATSIRQRVASSEPISELVPPLVEQYIKKNRLYVKFTS